MATYIVEMAVGYCASVEVGAESRDDAIKKAQDMVLDDPKEYLMDCEIEDINFVMKKKEKDA